MKGLEDNQMLKILSKELNCEPFNFNFTISSLSALSGQKLVKLLANCLAIIDSRLAKLIEGEEIEENGAKFIRRVHPFLIEIIRILKYKPFIDDPFLIQEGIEKGEQDVIFSLLSWITPRVEQLQSRIYLAKYLIKVQIPKHILQLDDEEVTRNYLKYEQMIEEFTAIHKKLEHLKKGKNLSVIQKDLQNLEYDKDCITRKVETVKKRAEENGDISEFKEAAKETRLELDKFNDLRKQFHYENKKISKFEYKASKLNKNYKIIREIDRIFDSPVEIVDEMQNKYEGLRFHVYEGYPGEIDKKRREILAIEKVLQNPPESEEDIFDIQKRIDACKFELHECYKTNQDFSEVKRILELAKERKEELKNELKLIKDELEDEKWKMMMPNSEENQTEEGFNKFVKSLKMKASKFKKMKLELNELMAESGHLSTTKFILQEKFNNIEDKLLKNIEKEYGIKGLTINQENLSLENNKNEASSLDLDNLIQISESSHEIKDKSNEKKTNIGILAKEIQKTRHEFLRIEMEYENCKRKTEDEMASFNFNNEKLELEIDKLKEMNAEKELKICSLTAENKINNANIEICKNQSKETFKNSKKKLLEKIKRVEERRISLKNILQSNVKNDEEKVEQLKMWKDLERILSAKIDYK